MRVIFKRVMSGVSVSKSLYCLLTPGASLVDDIVLRLQQLLNLHQQSYHLFPQMGLPFLPVAYQQEQNSAEQLQRLIIQLINRYEKRLQNTDVTLLENVKPSRLCFRIQADLQQVRQYFCVIMSDEVKVHQVEHDRYDN